MNARIWVAATVGCGSGKRPYTRLAPASAETRPLPCCGATSNVERPEEPGFRTFVHDHDEARVVAEPSLHDASHRDLVAPQDLGDPRQDARTVGHLEVQVEGGVDVAHDLE